MSLDSHYQKIKFLSTTRELAIELYSIEDSESPIYKTKGSELDGFLKAGIILDIANKDEIQKIIDEEHWSIFGITRKQRRAEKKLNKPQAESDWKIYDKPTVQRKK